jgi:hypothetical protein
MYSLPRPEFSREKNIATITAHSTTKDCRESKSGYKIKLSHITLGERRDIKLAEEC